MMLVLSNGFGSGKEELSAMLRETGFRQCCFYYPFPHWRSPAVLLSEQAFDSELLDAGNLIEPVLLGEGYPYPLIHGLLNNGLMQELSSYFFVVVSDNPYWLADPNTLAWTFTPGRSDAFKKLTSFYRSVGGELCVRREPYMAAPIEAGPVRQELHEERYLPGRLYSLELAGIVSRKGWSVADVVAWARPYLALLQDHADAEGRLEGRYLDLVPFNLVVRKEGLAAIDLEWVAADRLPAGYVFFRGLYHSFSRVGPVGLPLEGTPTNLYGLCLAVAGALFPSVEGMLEAFLELEPLYFGVVFRNAAAPGDSDLEVRAGQWARQQLPGDRLYPLTNLNLQVFVEGPGKGFSEDTSTLLRIGLTGQRKVYSVTLPHFADDIEKLRIDPSDHSGLVQLHAVHLRSGGEELFYWTPYSRTEVELNGVLLLNAAPALPCPVMVLLNYDPMLVFTLPAINRKDGATPVVLEIEVSALTPALYGAVRNNLKLLSELFCER